MTERLLSAKEFAENHLGICVKQFYRLLDADPDFPASRFGPIRIDAQEALAYVKAHYPLGKFRRSTRKKGSDSDGQP